MRVLVTGGAGYIGSQTLVELLGQGHEALVVDSFANGNPVALDRVRALTNGHFDVLDCDIRDTMRLSAAARNFRPEAVIHFAGLKAVGESQRLPVETPAVRSGGGFTPPHPRGVFGRQRRTVREAGRAPPAGGGGQ